MTHSLGIPDRIETDQNNPNVVVITYLDGSQIRYIDRGNGVLIPGYLWVANTVNKHPGYKVTFFVPFGQSVMPELLKVEEF